MYMLGYMFYGMIDGTSNKSHRLLAANLIFILGEYVTGNSVSNPEMSWGDADPFGRKMT